MAYGNIGQVSRWLNLAKEAEARALASGDQMRRIPALAMRAAALNFCGVPAEALETGEAAAVLLTQIIIQLSSAACAAPPPGGGEAPSKRNRLNACSSTSTASMWVHRPQPTPFLLETKISLTA
jgi:hypothetical protein